MDLNIHYKTIISESDLINAISRIKKYIDFPYKKEYIKNDEKTLFNNLIKYSEPLQKVNEYNIVNIEYFKSKLINSTFKNEYFQFINDDDSNYEKINILSDYISEECRVHCKKYHTYFSPYDAFKNHKFLANLIKELISKQKDINWINLRELLYKKGECSNFKLTLAISIYKFFKVKRILDISAGWADRLISAIAYQDHIDYYNGFDPSKCMGTVYQKVIDKYANNTSKFSVENIPFEDAKLTKTYDLIFTSPPFFKLEIYNSESSQSTAKFNDVTSWFCNMLIVWLIKAWNKLEIGGHMVINLEDTISIKGKYKQQELYTEAMILFVSGFFKSSLYLGVIGHSNVGKDVVRPLWIWQKTDQKTVEYKNTKKKFRDDFKQFYPDEFGILSEKYLIHKKK